jgi:hypothetical protein
MNTVFNIKTMKKYFFIISTLLVFSSCKKWLDLTPQSQVAAGELFQTEEGFQEGLNGIYTRCGQADIYGNELTCGFLDVMAQNYDISTLNDPLGYFQTQNFNFTDGNFINRKDNVWKGLYNAIVNANIILANIDQEKNIFTGNNYALIKGEALALRAYLHFDVFRIFGSGFNSDSNNVGIPYVTTYSNRVTPSSSPSQVIDKILADLNAAKTLLGPVDSIRNSDYIVGYPSSATQTETTATTLFQQNRRHRLNYYAVCGELARVYLYKGDNTNALSNALEVINSNKFPWTNQADFINVDISKQDLILYKELIFGWYIPWEEADLKSRFESGSGGMFLLPTDAQNIYEANGVGGEDLRYKVWMQIGVDGNVELTKYNRNPNTTTDNDATVNLYPLMAPAMRLSEMYYIAAESTYDTDPATALNYFNTVRFQRGIGTPLSVSTKDAFLTELLKEARKEFFGEGQIFYMYKRLNRNIAGASGTVIPPGNNVFVLPLPNDEIEFGGR